VQHNYTCALTGYSLTATKTGATMVEAAHIAALADTPVDHRTGWR